MFPSLSRSTSAPRFSTIAPMLATTTPSWRGMYELPDAAAGQWQIGPLRLHVRRDGSRWRLVTEQLPDPLDPGVFAQCPIDAPEPLGAARIVATTGNHATLQLSAHLPARSVVARPVDPLTVLPGDHATLFVSLPIWVQVRWPGVDEPLLDVPTFRPSDTWFGPSLVDGEVCYATRTRARALLGEVAALPGRAISRLSIHNLSGAVLRLERVRLPVELLALHEDGRGQLWTDSLTYSVGEVALDADVKRHDGPAEEAGATSLVAPPRIDPRLRSWKRALSGLLG